MELALARWGFIPHWWKQEKPPRLTHNARSEEAATKPMWRTPLSKARCLIPALGWYEWQVVERVDQQTGEVRKAKQPHFIRLPGGEPICFAAADSVAQVHDRMPVVLGDDAHANWLDKNLNDGAEAIAFAREHAIVEFAHYAVSDRVNRPKEIDASLIERL